MPYERFVSSLGKEPRESLGWREILAQSRRFCRESLPRFPRTPPLQSWEEKVVLASWSQVEPRGAKQSPGTGPGKKQGQEGAPLGG